MKFFSSENLTTKTMVPCVPWEFIPDPAQVPSERVKHDKDERQAWYHTLETKWNFYTAMEGANPNQRVSADNPPKFLYGAVADFDISILGEVVESQLKKMPFPPTYIERSLGGNWRLIWIFETPIRVETMDFAIFIQQQMNAWLKLKLLPDLDEKAWNDPTRLYCNGGEWKKTGYGPIPEPRVQAFLVKCAEKFNFKAVSEFDIPMDTVEKMLREKYPKMTWEGEFAVDTQGPTFWVEESTSPKSAIVKVGGMFTFSAHATKNFYTWADLLGADKVKEYRDASLSKATKDIYFDGKAYYWKQHGYWFHGGEKEFETYLRADCNISDQRDKGAAASMMDKARRFVQDRQRIHVATNLVFHNPGVYTINGSRVLNLYSNNQVIRPASEPAIWGPDGQFPFLSLYFDTFFATPSVMQLQHYLVWLKAFYMSALYCRPTKGQVVGIGGGAGVGKNFNDRGIVGRIVGGFTDASEFLMARTSWNADLFAQGLWCVDDETSLVSNEQREIFQNFLKKVTANSDFRIQRRFSDEIRAQWFGRVMFTFNLDARSVCIIPRCDNTSGDKIILYKAVEERQVDFGQEFESIEKLDRELPWFCRWLHDMEPSAEFKAEWMTDNRYGLKHYHHPDLLAQAYSTSPEATLKELLMELLVRHFSTGTEKDYTLSAVQMARALAIDGTNQTFMRNLTPSAIDRYMANIHREGLMPCIHSSSANRTNIWTFKRDDYTKKS